MGIKAMPHLLLFTAVLVSSCSGPVKPDYDSDEDSEPSKDFNIQDLYQSWTHSWEEEQEADTIRIYRPSNFKDFPGGWFRMKYVFYENGDCEWLYLHPADAHYMKPGKWKIDPKDSQVIHIYDEADQLVEPLSFRIIELKKDLLRVVPVWTAPY